MWRTIQEYHRPRSLEQALALRAERPGACFAAGGTDLFVQLGRAPADAPPTSVISLRAVEELLGVTTDEESGRTRIGAAVTIAELLAHPLINDNFPVLAQACAVLGSPQIRNVATVGGNLCNASPCADTAPPLLALEARVELVDPAGGTRELPLEEFFTGPGETALAPDELLGAVLLQRQGDGACGLFLKKRRVRMDLALASVAAQVKADGRWCERARLAAGSVAPTPIRLREVERLLEGKEISGQLLLEAQKLSSRIVAPISDLRTTEEYRRGVVGVYVRRALDQLFAQEAA
jgi:CO/xanthine dehydrogenase FAD-binding subunit